MSDSVLPTCTTAKTKKFTPIASKLESSLGNYFAASSGACQTAATVIAGLLALPHLAEAKVVYTPANQSLNGPINTYQIDLNNDGVADVSINVYSSVNVGSGYERGFFSMGAHGAQTGNEVVANAKGLVIAGRRGQVVGPPDPFAANGVMGTSFDLSGPHGTSSHRQKGQWFKVNDRFVGVKFEINGETHYGWLRLNVLGPNSGLLTGYAYQTEPNTPITAGFPQDDAVVVRPSSNGNTTRTPQVHKVVPASLGALAAGAGVMSQWREQAGSAVETSK